MDDFSGYIAADELYDGPYCVLSIVDNRTFKRIAYQVLDHDPTHDDIRDFFHRFQAALKERGLELQGITTDGSALYPVPIADVFGDVPHQICEFHVLGGVDESRAPRRDKSSQGPGCRTAQAGPGTTFFEAEPTRRSAQEADRAEDSRPVRASLSVRAAPAQPS